MIGRPLGGHLNGKGKSKFYDILIGETVPTIAQGIGFDSTEMKMKFHDGTGVRNFLSDLDKISIHPDAADLLELVDGTKLRMKQLAMKQTFTDDVAADLAAWVASNYTAGNELQDGDMLILTTPAQVYLHNGGSAGTTDDFTLVETPGMSAANIRAALSADNGVLYNVATGNFSLGGSLIRDTVINATGNSLSVTNAKSFSVGSTGLVSMSSDAQVQLISQTNVEIGFGSQFGLSIGGAGGAAKFWDNRASKKGIQLGFTDWTGLEDDSLAPVGLMKQYATSKYDGKYTVVDGTEVVITHNLALNHKNSYVINIVDEITDESYLAVNVTSIDENSLKFTPDFDADVRVVVVG